MENSVLPEAAQPDFAAFEAEVRARLSQRQALPPDALQGVARLGRLVQALRSKQRWSLQALATQTGLPWLWLALLEQGLLLPAELTAEAVQQLGRAFPLQHGGADPAMLFAALAATLRQLPLSPEPAPASLDEAAASAPLAGALQTLGERLVRWLSPLWHPPLAGEPVSAADTAAQEEVFYLDEGSIRVTCRWWAASQGQPAALWIAWYADIALPGDCSVRFTRRDAPTAVLAEMPLGGALTGEAGWSADELGFDPTREPWALTLVLTEPPA